MAKKSGIDALARLAFDSYAIPTQYGHSTVMAILSRLSQTEDGTVFEGGAQREWADRALFRAHYMLLITLALQADQFGVSGLKESIEVASSDFDYIWERFGSPPGEA
ncbi:MAG: hypothetical protein ACLPND_03185 [Candidatus Korobacteraceae bacterium]